MRKMRKEDGKVPIYARINIDGKSKEISTGARCLPDYWDSKAKMIDASDKSTACANLRLVQVKSELESHFLVLCSTRPVVTAELLKEVYEEAKPGQLKETLVDDKKIQFRNIPFLKLQTILLKNFLHLK